MVLTPFSTPHTAYSADFRYLDRQDKIDCGTQGFNKFKLHQPAYSDGVYYEGDCGGVDVSNLSPTTSQLESQKIYPQNGRLENLQDLPVDCSNKRVGGVVSQFYLSGQDTDHNSYQYKCKGLVDGKAPQCGAVRYTDWFEADDDTGSLGFLDRHTVACGDGESVSSFVLQNGANAANPAPSSKNGVLPQNINRIKYTCCKAEACGANSIHYRSVTCKDQSGNLANDSFCSGAGAKPAVSESCNPPAIFSWVQGGYVGAICDTKTNKVTQEVLCKDQDGSVYTDEYCSKAGAKPSTTKDCDKTYSWLVGEWQATQPAKENFKFTSSASSSMHHYLLIALFIIALLYIIKRK
jgi:hypothetical protein